MKEKSEKVLLLRTCDKGMKGYGGFQWPKSGSVEAPDWNPNSDIDCGRGLHGLLWGNGDWSLLSSAVDANWMIISVDTADGIVVGKTKARFRKGEVIYCGNQIDATMKILCSREAFARNLKEAKEQNRQKGAASSGYGSTAASSGTSSKAASSGDCSKAASSGDCSTAASSGDCSKAASSGYGSTAASSGYGSTAASSGDHSKAASSGDHSTAASSGYGSTAASSGYGSTAASSGDCSKAASSGDCSTAASSGDHSKAASSGYGSTAASSGYGSTAASSGYGSTAASSGTSSKAASSGYGVSATIGIDGQAKAGENGLIILTWWDSAEQRYRACVGEVGIGGIVADTWYRVRDGKLVVT